MHPDSRALLWDAFRAIALARDFTDSRSFDDYRADVLVRSAVERRPKIIVSALNVSRALMLRRRRGAATCCASWPAATSSFTDTPEIDNAFVSSVVSGRLSALEQPWNRFFREVGE